jgi:ArsR family transcriptional regulator
MKVYNHRLSSAEALSGERRWLLYRLLGDPSRLRLLALLDEEELSIGELSGILDEAQPNISRHASQLRQSGLVQERRSGTRAFLRVSSDAKRDSVVLDAIAVGRTLCAKERRFERLATVVSLRREELREDVFAHVQQGPGPSVAREAPVYALALSRVTGARRLAIDAGTGSGAMVDILAPYFDRVIAIDSSSRALELAAARVRARGYRNVELVCADLNASLTSAVTAGLADVVFATRLLGQVPSPIGVLGTLRELVTPGGRIVIIDQQPALTPSGTQPSGDIGVGLTQQSLLSLVQQHNLIDVEWSDISPEFVGTSGAGAPRWQLVSARRPVVSGIGEMST